MYYFFILNMTNKKKFIMPQMLYFKPSKKLHFLKILLFRHLQKNNMKGKCMKFILKKKNLS